MKISLKTALLVFTLILLVVILIPRPRPCTEPLTYRIGKVDERFGLSPQEAADAVKKAALIWAKAASRTLLRESPEGLIEINFIYDYRQEATDKLKLLSYHIDNTKGSYDDLKNHLERLKREYDQKSSALSSDFSSHDARVNAFNNEAKTARQQGAMTETVYKRLTLKRETLHSLRDALQARQEELNRLIDTINNLVVAVNEIASNLNLDLVHYQNTGETLGREFHEGNYIIDKGKRAINIYQFSNSTRLIRVLSHELGHALGLKHSDRPEAMMYRLNQADSLELAQDDIALLNARCEGK